MDEILSWCPYSKCSSSLIIIAFLIMIVVAITSIAIVALIILLIIILLSIPLVIIASIALCIICSSRSLSSLIINRSTVRRRLTLVIVATTLSGHSSCSTLRTSGLLLAWRVVCLSFVILLTTSAVLIVLILITTHLLFCLPLLICRNLPRLVILVWIPNLWAMSIALPRTCRLVVVWLWTILILSTISIISIWLPWIRLILLVALSTRIKPRWGIDVS